MKPCKSPLAPKRVFFVGGSQGRSSALRTLPYASKTCLPPCGHDDLTESGKLPKAAIVCSEI